MVLLLNSLMGFFYTQCFTFSRCICVNACGCSSFILTALRYSAVRNTPHLTWSFSCQWASGLFPSSLFSQWTVPSAALLLEDGKDRAEVIDIPEGGTGRKRDQEYRAQLKWGGGKGTDVPCSVSWIPGAVTWAIAFNSPDSGSFDYLCLISEEMDAGEKGLCQDCAAGKRWSQMFDLSVLT